MTCLFQSKEQEQRHQHLVCCLGHQEMFDQPTMILTKINHPALPKQSSPLKKGLFVNKVTNAWENVQGQPAWRTDGYGGTRLPDLLDICLFFSSAKLSLPLTEGQAAKSLFPWCDRWFHQLRNQDSLQWFVLLCTQTFFFGDQFSSAWVSSPKKYNTLLYFSASPVLCPP